MSPTHGTPFPLRHLHARLVWCWPACLWSVYCRVFFSEAFWLVHCCVSRLTIGLFVVGSIALQPAPAQPDVVLVVLSASPEVCCGRPVRCGGHCVATGARSAPCVGSPSSWLPVVGLSGVVRSSVWAWPAAFGPCRPSLTLFVSRRVCFVVAHLFLTCPCGRWLRCCQHYAWLLLLVSDRLRRLMISVSCCWMRSAVAAVRGRFPLFWLRWAGTACFCGPSPSSRLSLLRQCLAFLLVARLLGGGKFLKKGMTCPVPPWSQRYMHNPSSCTSRCRPAVLSVSLVPIVCTPPSVAKPLRSSSRCSLLELRSAVPAWWCADHARIRGPVVSGGLCTGTTVRLPEVRVILLGCTPVFSVAWRFSGLLTVVATTSALVPWCSLSSGALRIGVGVAFVPQPPALRHHMLADCVSGRRGPVCAVPFLDAEGLRGLGDRGPRPRYVGGMGSLGSSA